jgi:hypothetical protein
MALQLPVLAIPFLVSLLAMSSEASFDPASQARVGDNTNFDPASQARVADYVDMEHGSVFRAPNGSLTYPYLVPSGPYHQLWDWDSYFMGVALLTRGSAKYLLGSAENFLDAVDLATGHVPGCLTPQGPSKTLVQAKPVLAQMLLLGGRAVENGTGSESPSPSSSALSPSSSSSSSSASSPSPQSSFSWAALERHRPALESFLRFWDVARADPGGSGLSLWFNQMESGADNLPISKPGDELTVAAADLATFLFREHTAFAALLEVWGRPEQAAAERAKAERVADAAVTWLFDKPGLSRFAALNTTTRAPIENRVFLMAFPLFAGPAMLSAGNRNGSAVAAACAAEIASEDMLSAFGIRSTSTHDPLYTNANMIVPDSNWRGPVWIVSNAAIAYGLATFGHADLARTIAERIVTTLARDLDDTGEWHECYDSAVPGVAGRGRGLAAGGFLSWNMLAADLLPNLAAGINPFALPGVATTGKP